MIYLFEDREDRMRNLLENKLTWKCMSKTKVFYYTAVNNKNPFAQFLDSLQKIQQA